MTILSESALKRLAAILDIVSPSMQEHAMISYLGKDWTSVLPTAAVNVDAIGNLEFAARRSETYPTLALVAHADTICVQITQCVGCGRYRFRSVGCSPHMLLGQKMIIVNESGEKFIGMVGFDATSQYGQPKGLVFEDLWIDLLDPSDSGHIEPGDLAVLCPTHAVKGDFICGTGLDDRLGLFVIGEVLRWYSQSDICLNLSCVATVQEEVGLRGSLALAFGYEPDAAIVLDVDYATDIPSAHEDQLGRLYPGKGPGVLRKADNSPELRRLVREVAADRHLMLQTSLGRFLYGGTDCSSLQVSRHIHGFPVANITLPLRYMHSPVETASLSDVSQAVGLVCGVAEALARKGKMVP